MTNRFAIFLTLLGAATASTACGASEPAGRQAPQTNRVANQRSAPSGRPPISPSASADAARMPAEIQGVFLSKCSVCHGVDARGGPAAPNILAFQPEHTVAEWEAYLANTKVWDRENRMAVVPLSDEERRNLAAWLAGVAGSEAPPGGGNLNGNGGGSRGAKQPAPAKR